jgi:hypothetical protein
MQFQPKHILIPTILSDFGAKYLHISLLATDRYPTRLGLVAVLGETNGCNQNDWGSKQSTGMYLKYWIWSGVLAMRPTE